VERSKIARVASSDRELGKRGGGVVKDDQYFPTGLIRESKGKEEEAKEPVRGQEQAFERGKVGVQCM